MFDNIFQIIYLIGLFIGGIVRVIYTKNLQRDKIAFDRKLKLDPYLLALASIGMALPILYISTTRLDFANYAIPGWVGWIGTVVFAFAQWMLWRSHADLGRNWSPTPQIKDEHTLITHGVFQYIRHPMYAAHLLWAIGQALLLYNWIAGPALLVFFLPLYLLRVSAEENMLLEHFGEEYRAYMNRTGRIFPKLTKSP